MKKCLVSILFMLGSMVCLLSYIGQQTLVSESVSESFFLIPLAGVLATLGIIIGIYKGLR